MFTHHADSYLCPLLYFFIGSFYYESNCNMQNYSNIFTAVNHILERQLSLNPLLIVLVIEVKSQVIS